jgi:hypothetical protein
MHATLQTRNKVLRGSLTRPLVAQQDLDVTRALQAVAGHPVGAAMNLCSQVIAGAGGAE